MRDAVTALQSAISELERSADTLPDDLADGVRALIAKAQELIETLRSKIETVP